MNKAQLAARLSLILSIRKKAAEYFLEAFEAEVIRVLSQGEEVHLSGFGVFFTAERKSRMGVHPRSPSTPLVIPQVRVGKFRPGKNMKEALKATPENL